MSYITPQISILGTVSLVTFQAVTGALAGIILVLLLISTVLTVYFCIQLKHNSHSGKQFKLML